MMATDTASTAGTFSDTAMQCPDPSVHEKHQKLSEQASSAALHATHPDRQAGKDSPLGPDGKLSSKSAATSLKYARAQDLPSYPSHGVNVAHSASAAAVQAKDYKMKELWQPELSSAGSRAALLAHKKGSNLEFWQPTASDTGNSAAVLAMRNQKSLELDRGYTADGRNSSLLAATKSHHEGRRRAGSTPAPVHPAYPDSHNSAHNALNAANVSHRGGSTRQTDSNRYDSDAMQAARIQNLGNHMDRRMFTEHPDVDIEKDERRRQAALRASAVSMAKEMYQAQNRSALRTPDESGLAGAGAGTAHSRAPAPGETDLKQEAMRYIHLQEAAHKLAAERLAKVEKDMEWRRNMEYYGYDQQPQRKSRLSIRGRRGRASSDPDKDLEKSDSSDDERQARKVRSQMSGLTKQMEDVEAKKQATDRANLLVAAQKRVQNQMNTMDEKVFAETGKVSDAMLEQWELKARKRAEDERAERTKNHGKTHLGGGKFMDQSEIEAIALARLKPTLNDIDKTAAERRQRDEELRLEKEAAEREKQSEKARQRLDKATAKQEKDADKARKKEEKAMAKEDKKRTKEARKEAEKATALAAGGAAAGGAVVAAEGADTTTDATRPGLERLHTGDHTDAVAADDGTETRGLNLNRHISNIDTSESSDAEDEDEDLERPRTATTDGEAPSAVAAPSSSSAKAPDAEPSSPESPRKSRGFTGLFSKMRKSKSEREPGKISASKQRGSTDEPTPTTSAAATGVTAEDHAARRSESTADPRKSVDTSEHVGTDGPIGMDRKVSGLGGDPRAASPSSFARRQETRGSVDSAHVGTDGPIGVDNKVSGVGGDPGAASPSSFAKRDRSLSPVSSLSSSGIEEEDIKRGRTGRLARKMGLGKLRRKNKDNKESKGKEPAAGAAASKSSPAPAAATPAASDDNTAQRTITNDTSRTDGSDNETFEEARDTFDESRAPQPAFAGQQKNESPARGTRFHEEM